MTVTFPAGSRAHVVIDSPVGPITLVAEGSAVAGVYLAEHRHSPGPAAFGRRDPGPDQPGAAGHGPLAMAAAQLAEYFAGRRTEFELDIVLHGTAFQQRVWQALRDIGYGETISYGELARRIGQPSGSRAVGLANGRNPVSIIVPCHRVVGSDGSLTGYGGGLDRKHYLLELERRVASQAAG